MKNVYIMEALTCAIEQKIMDEWKHEGFIGGFSSEYINFSIDDKEYVLLLKEIPDNGNFSDFLREG